MATRLRNHGLPPPRRFQRGIITHPVRMSNGTIRHVSVPVDFPTSLTYEGRLYAETGRLGYRISDRVQAAEYGAVELVASSTGRHLVWLGKRIWMAVDGAICPGDGCPRPPPFADSGSKT
jgi:hypothetical protein